MFKFVQQVFEDPSRIGDINQTLLTLIPKVHDPSRPSNFRPISLCNVVYKVITKIITNRMKPFLPYIISPNQSSFISGCSTTDNIIVLQEVAHSMNHMVGKKRFMVIKLNLAKAYDKMEWIFIKESLELLHFPPHIVGLISECLSSSSFSTNWKGRPSPKFFPSRGLRQGDPLSPLFFVIAIERLRHCIQDAINNDVWHPLKFGRGGLEVSHLLFADDILLVAEASTSNVQIISDILLNFAASSGQTINKAKSCIFFSHNTPLHVATSINGQLGIAATSSLGRYLGVPIISGHKGRGDFSFLIDKV